jgi:hypothetical protein
MNRYNHTLKGELVIDIAGFKPICEFQNKWLHIEEGRVTISDRYSCDGATFAPDLKSVMRGVYLHDAFYQFAEMIAQKWGISVKEVLRIADCLFRVVIELDGTHPAIAYVYYRAVRLLGYNYHQVARVIRRWFGLEFKE